MRRHPLGNRKWGMGNLKIERFLRLRLHLKSEIRNHYCPVRSTERTSKCFHYSEQQTKVIVADLKIAPSFWPILRQEGIDESGTDRLQPNLGVRVVRRFLCLRATLRRQQRHSPVLVLGTI